MVGSAGIDLNLGASWKHKWHAIIPHLWQHNIAGILRSSDPRFHKHTSNTCLLLLKIFLLFKLVFRGKHFNQIILYENGKSCISLMLKVTFPLLAL